MASTVNCPTKTEVKLYDAAGMCYPTPAYVTMDPVKLQPTLPYDTQTATFRLFTTREVTTTFNIDRQWRITQVDRHYERRVFVKAVMPILRSPRQVRIIEMTREEGPDSRTVPKDRGEYTAGALQVNADATIVDDRKVPRDSMLYAFCEPVNMVADRWQVHDGDHAHTVKRIIDIGRPDRPPIFVCEVDRKRA